MTRQRVRIQRSCMTATSTVTDGRRWFIIDADNAVLGRLASRIATILRGKHTPQYTPHDDTGDFVIVINAAKIRVTGNKERAKTYARYSGYPGGLRHRTLAEQRQRDARYIIQHAVKGMLPKNRLGRQQLRKLHVYAGPHHNHQAQQPQPLTIGARV